MQGILCFCPKITKKYFIIFSVNILVGFFPDRVGRGGGVERGGKQGGEQGGEVP